MDDAIPLAPAVPPALAGNGVAATVGDHHDRDLDPVVGVSYVNGVVDLGGLLDLASRGNVAAAAAVYDQVSVSVYRLVRLVVGEPVLAADVCRRGFTHLWSAWTAATANDAVRPLSPQTWTLSVMHGFAMQHMRPTVISDPNTTAAFDTGKFGLPARGSQRRLVVFRLATHALDQWRRRR